MKKILTTMMYSVLLSLVFHSCSEEESSTEGGSADDVFTGGTYCALSADLYIDGTISGESQDGNCEDIDGEGQLPDTESTCTAAGFVWTDGATIFCEFCATFDDDGTFINYSGDTGTWTMDENTLTALGDDGDIFSLIFLDGMLTLNMLPTINCIAMISVIFLETGET